MDEYIEPNWSDDEERSDNDPRVEWDLARFMSEEVPFEIPRD